MELRKIRNLENQKGFMKNLAFELSFKDNSGSNPPRACLESPQGVISVAKGMSGLHLEYLVQTQLPWTCGNIPQVNW